MNPDDSDLRLGTPTPSSHRALHPFRDAGIAHTQHVAQIGGRTLRHFLLTEGMVLASLTPIAYLLAFAYKRGGAFSLGIPVDIVAISPADVVPPALAVLLVAGLSAAILRLWWFIVLTPQSPDRRRFVVRRTLVGPWLPFIPPALTFFAIGDYFPATVLFIVVPSLAVFELLCAKVELPAIRGPIRRAILVRHGKRGAAQDLSLWWLGRSLLWIAVLALYILAGSRFAFKVGGYMTATRQHYLVTIDQIQGKRRALLGTYGTTVVLAPIDNLRTGQLSNVRDIRTLPLEGDFEWVFFPDGLKNSHSAPSA